MRTALTLKRGPRIWSRLLHHSGCLHHSLVGLGDHTGRCLECGVAVPTPFTVHGC